jgi:hypothetical protein
MSTDVCQKSETTIVPPPPADLSVRGNRMSFLLWFDTSLLVLFLLTMNLALTGLAIHEILGIVFIIIFIVHILLSWQWIKAGARKLVTKGAWRMRMNYFLNAMLFALTWIAIVAGLVVSEVVLPALHIPSANDRAWHRLHDQMALLWLPIGVALHIAMNWQWIVAAVRRQTASWRGRCAEAQTAVLAQPADLLEQDVEDACD